MGKEKKMIKAAEMETPGPGAYEIKMDYTEEKGPLVNNNIKIVFTGRQTR
jgi:hypothetical protein